MLIFRFLTMGVDGDLSPLLGSKIGADKIGGSPSSAFGDASGIPDFIWKSVPTSYESDKNATKTGSIKKNAYLGFF